MSRTRGLSWPMPANLRRQRVESLSKAQSARSCHDLRCRHAQSSIPPESASRSAPGVRVTRMQQVPAPSKPISSPSNQDSRVLAAWRTN